MLRSRGKSVSWKTIKDFDAFPKVSDTYIEASPIGGALSILSWVVITWIIYWEVTFYLDAHFTFRFLPDTEFDAKLKVNVDLTVAMPCANLGADILDSTNQNILQFGHLEEEDTWFELSPQQRAHFDAIKQLNTYLREESHALQDLLWRSLYSSLFGDMPPRDEMPDYPHDACRFHGTLSLNKVAGNLHVTAGKTLSLPQGHFHLSAISLGHNVNNFSHRVERFSFGDPSPGIIHPLEGDEKVTNESAMLYQYFLEVVGTEVSTMWVPQMSTYQYSARAHERPVDHAKDSHGIPGIYFKYDMGALRVKVTQERDSSVPTFMARLCAIVGGVYVCVGILSRILLFLSTSVTNRLSSGSWSQDNSLADIKSGVSKAEDQPVANPSFFLPAPGGAAVSLDAPLLNR